MTVLIGLIADTHIPEAGPHLPEVVLTTLAGCERILHCGDLHTIDVVDALDAVAPTIVSRGNGDTASARTGRPGVPADERIAESFVLDIDRVRIGITHDLEHLEGRRDDDAAAILARIFGAPVDIVVCGHTHVPMVWGLADGTAIVNPGSATMPYGYLGTLGTVGLLAIDGDRFDVSVVDLATGTTQLRLEGPAQAPYRRGPRPAGGR